MRKIYRFVIPLVLLMVAGCGGSKEASDNGLSETSTTNDSKNSPRIQLISAATDTVGAKSAHINMSIDSQGTQTASSISMKIDGIYDFQKKQGSETMTVSGGSTGDFKIEALLDGTTVYQKLPADQLPPEAEGSPWIKVDLSKTSQGIDYKDVLGGKNSDPSQGLSMLLATDEVTKVGTEQVRGASATHYKAMLDFKKAESTLSDKDKAVIGELGKIYGDQKIPVDVWVDTDNRVRKMTYSFDTSKIGVSSSTTSTVLGGGGIYNFVIEFYDFGVPVNISIPPADQIAEY